MSENPSAESVRVIERPAREVKAYARRKHLLVLAHFAVGAAFLAAMLLGGSGAIVEKARFFANGGFYGTVFFYFAAFSLAYLFVTLPLTFYQEYALERHFGLSDQTLGRWAWRRIRKWLVSFLLAAPLVLLIYGFLRRWPQTWWISASAAWVCVAYVLAKFSPQILIPLFYKLEPVADRDLAGSLTALAAKAGVPIVAVCRIDLSRETKKANAAVVGLGSSRRVVLGDTLLSAFTRDEIAVVFAHELAHIRRHHLLKGFIAGAVLITAAFYAGSLALSRAAALLGVPPHDPQTLPVLVAVVAALIFAVLPFEKWYSRSRELRCDLDAVRLTGLRGPFISAMTKLGHMNLADVRPGRLAEIFLYDHPPIAKRIRAAEALEMDPEP